MTHKRNICLIYPSKLARGPNFPIALLSLWCVIERMREEWNFEHRETAIPLLKMWRCSASANFWRCQNTLFWGEGGVCCDLQEVRMWKLVTFTHYTVDLCSKCRVSSCFSFFFFPDSPDVKESQEVLFYVFLLKCLFPSIHCWGCFVCCHHPWFRECVESPMAWQLEEKRVATAVKAGCLLMSRPAEWMRTQMGFLSGGLFFWAGLSVVGDMGTLARIDWHLIEWGKT